MDEIPGQKNAGRYISEEISIGRGGAHGGMDRKREAVEAGGQTRLCELMSDAALERRESRGRCTGGHDPTDYPDRDAAGWLKNIVLGNRGGTIVASREEPVPVDDLSRMTRNVIATTWLPPDDPAHWSESENSNVRCSDRDREQQGCMRRRDARYGP